MPTHELLPSQKNEIYMLLREAGLEPTEFRWQEATSRQTSNLKCPQLLHERSKFYYRFDLKLGHHFCEFSPGSNVLTESAYPGDWRSQQERFKMWLPLLKREISQPDLWAAAAHERELYSEVSAAATSVENAPFSADERSQIKISVGEIRSYFTKIEQNAERLQFIEERLEYLIESSERLGKKDWLNLTLGVVANIVTAVASSPQMSHDVLRVIGGALGWLFGGTPLLPNPLQ